MNKIIHVHHIIPSYLGGSDEASNLIELTVDQHAEAHRELFEKYGNKEDYIAWKALSGQVKDHDLAKLIYELAGQRSSEARIANRGSEKNLLFRKNRSERYKGKGNPMYGVKRQGKDSTNLKHIIVTPKGQYYGLGDAIRNNPGIPIRKWCMSRVDVPFTVYSVSMSNLYTKEQIIGKTPRELGYYTIQYDNQQPSQEIGRFNDYPVTGSTLK